jgi:hypothetical protein
MSGNLLEAMYSSTEASPATDFRREAHHCYSTLSEPLDYPVIIGEIDPRASFSDQKQIIVQDENLSMSGKPLEGVPSSTAA